MKNKLTPKRKAQHQMVSLVKYTKHLKENYQQSISISFKNKGKNNPPPKTLGDGNIPKLILHGQHYPDGKGYYKKKKKKNAGQCPR